MKMNLKSMLAATAIAVGATAMFPGMANAGIDVSIGVGVPGVVMSPYGPNYSAYDDNYYYDPIYISGSWYHGPYRWRMHNGERQFYVNDSWHRNEWRDNSYPDSITFTNGGYYSNRRYNGFVDADRINARFSSDDRDMRDDHRMNDRDMDYSPYEGSYYYDPIYISGSWYHGPYRWRTHHGERQYYVNGRWRRNEWTGGEMPMSITFRNGGDYRDHRYNGFYGADRINARYDSHHNRDHHNDGRDDRHDDRNDDNRDDHDSNH